MRTKPAHIAPGCQYCNADHDPDILCRNIAATLQQEMRPPRPALRREVVRVTDHTGKTVAVQHIYREIA